MKNYIDRLRRWCSIDTISQNAGRISDNKGFIGVILPLGGVVAVIIIIAAVLFSCLDSCSCGFLSCFTDCACGACESCVECVSPCLSCCDSCYCGTR